MSAVNQTKIFNQIVQFTPEVLQVCVLTFIYIKKHVCIDFKMLLLLDLCKILLLLDLYFYVYM
jgi:hypothetical protein